MEGEKGGKKRRRSAGTQPPGDELGFAVPSEGAGG